MLPCHHDPIRLRWTLSLQVRARCSHMQILLSISQIWERLLSLVAGAILAWSEYAALCMINRVSAIFEFIPGYRPGMLPAPNFAMPRPSAIRFLTNLQGVRSTRDILREILTKLALLIPFYDLVQGMPDVAKLQLSPVVCDHAQGGLYIHPKSGCHATAQTPVNG